MISNCLYLYTYLGMYSLNNNNNNYIVKPYLENLGLRILPVCTYETERNFGDSVLICIIILLHRTKLM